MTTKSTKTADGVPGPGWLTREEMAALFGVLPNSFDGGARKLLPAQGPHIRRLSNPRRVLFRARDFVQAWHQGELEKALADTAADPMLTGGATPALEDYRRERAIMAKLDRQEREGFLLPKDDVHSGLMRIMLPIRNAGERLRREFGNRAGEVLEEALDDARRGITEMFGPEQEAAS